MKILFAIKALDDIKGGAERVLADITDGLVSQGHEVSILTFDHSGGESFYPLNENIKRICLGIGNVQKSSTIIETLKRIKALRHAVKNENPDIVVAFMHSMFVPMAFSMVGTGKIIIASEHIVPAHYKTRPFEFLLLILSSFFVKKITVLSDTVKNSYPKFLHSKMVPISNPVYQPEIFADTKGDGAKQKIILSVGRLDLQKDQKTLISAFAGIAAKYPKWNLCIIGEGHLRNELETQIKFLGLEGRIFIPGATSDISAQYRAAHIFALPSIYESFGLATAEAMAHELPTIGFASCPGTNEIIKDKENGILLGDGDRVEILSMALDKLINNPDLRSKYGEAGRKSVQKYGHKNIIRKWEHLLKV